MRHFVIAIWGSGGFRQVRKGGPQKSIALIRSKRTLALRVLGWFSSSIAVLMSPFLEFRQRSNRGCYGSG